MWGDGGERDEWVDVAARYMVLFVTAVSSPALMPLMSSLPVVSSAAGVSPMSSSFVAGIAQHNCVL